MRVQKDAYYFPHDCNAKDDPKCVLLIEQLGLEGYGIFWVLVETLREQPDFRYPIKLIPALARRYNTTAEKMKAVVFSYGLFIVRDDRFFFSESLNRRMQIYLDKKKALSEAGKKGNQIRWHNKKITEQLGSDNLAIANKVNKNKINKNISLEDVKIDLYEDINPPDDGIQRNWESLKKWLVDLRATREQANRIILFSNYGEIGTPIWKLFNEIRNAGGQIKQPVLFVLSRLV